MSSKPKSKTFVLIHGGNYGEPHAKARYLVGAKNEKEAEEILKKKIGKHAKVNVYYKDENNRVKYGEVIKEC